MYDFSLALTGFSFYNFHFMFRSYTSQFRVDHDTSAIFANDHFLTRTDVQLSLRRNLVKATTARVTLYIYNAQSIAGVLTDTFEGLKQTRFNLSFQFFGFVS